MKTILLHKDVYFPKLMQDKVNLVINKYKTYKLSNHVTTHAVEFEDRSHSYTLAGLGSALDKFFAESSKVVEAFEVEMTLFDFPKPHCLITKICLRAPYSDTQDVCLSIRTCNEGGKFDTSKAFIVTAWLNHKNDSHFTLDASKYADEKVFNEFKSEFNKLQSK